MTDVSNAMRLNAHINEIRAAANRISASWEASTRVTGINEALDDKERAELNGLLTTKANAALNLLHAEEVAAIDTADIDEQQAARFRADTNRTTVYTLTN
ncbi:MAG: hypothetical protein AAGC61_08125 [Microbacterium sp.]